MEGSVPEAQKEPPMPVAMASRGRSTGCMISYCFCFWCDAIGNFVERMMSRQLHNCSSLKDMRLLLYDAVLRIIDDPRQRCGTHPGPC